LLESDGLDEKGYVGVAGTHLLEGFGGFAEVADVAAGADGFFVEAEKFFENDFVQLRDVELLLALGEAGE
jgi:hypothetical protein